MKHLLTLFMFAAFYCCSAQSYQPFPVTSGYWKYQGKFHDMGAYFVNDIQLMATNEQITINGKLYYKIKMRRSSDGGGSGFPTPDNIADGDDYDFAAIREQDKRVYFSYNSQPELILFDFNVQVGDKMPIVSTGAYNGRLSDQFTQQSAKVISIDHVGVYDATRQPKDLKRFNLENGVSAIEGVGGNFGLFTYPPKYDVYTFEYICTGTEFTACDYIWPLGTPLSVAEQNALEEFSVYPNPCNDELNIETVTAGNVHVYSMLGRLVNTSSVAKGVNTIHLSGNVPGAYKVYLKDVNGRLLGKQTVIKQ